MPVLLVSQYCQLLSLHIIPLYLIIFSSSSFSLIYQFFYPSLFSFLFYFNFTILNIVFVFSYINCIIFHIFCAYWQLLFLQKRPKFPPIYFHPIFSFSVLPLFSDIVYALKNRKQKNRL